MAHEILSIKLFQLDDRMERLHSRIYRSETANHEQLEKEMDLLGQEYAETESALRENLWRSKSELVSVLARSYGQIERIIQNTRDQIQSLSASSPDAQATTEGKILLAEYALDFAHQAADRALLLSMEAIDTQLLEQRERKTS